MRIACIDCGEELRARGSVAEDQAHLRSARHLAATARFGAPDPNWPPRYECPDCGGTSIHATDCPIVIRRARGG